MGTTESKADRTRGGFFVLRFLFVDLLMFLFGVLGGMCAVNSCNVFLLLVMALRVPISTTLFRRAVLVLWHAFLFLGLRFVPLFFLLLGSLHCFFCKKFLYFFVLR
jgi:hypothetical protein